MNKKQTMVATMLTFSLLINGCAQVTTSIRQNDGTYRTSKHWVFRSDLPGRSFRCDEDYMIASKFHDVTYAWPQGKGSYSKNFDEISFEGNQINCNVVGRKLSVNGMQFKELEKGDNVRITSDGKVFVNDIEREPLGDS